MTWKRDVTGAAMAERNGRFLPVEERAVEDYLRGSRFALELPLDCA